jgi:hypothetical protein
MKRTIVAIALALAGSIPGAAAQEPAGLPSPSEAVPGTGEANLVRNPSFDQLEGGGNPIGYELDGGATYRKSLGNAKLDVSDAGIAFRGAGPGGSVSQTIGIDPRRGRAFSFRFRGLPQDGFEVPANGLSMKVEFFGNGGRTAYDGKLKQLFPIVQQARHDMAVNGDLRVGGAAVWRDYVLNFYVPFPQVDRLRLTVSCTGGGEMSTDRTQRIEPDLSGNGLGTGRGPGGYGRGPQPKLLDTGGDNFFVTDFSLTAMLEPVPARAKETPEVTQGVAQLLPLGGRWYYAAKPGETGAPAAFDHSNAERLLYRDGPTGQCEIPFFDNMSATLRAGDKDLAGNTVTADRIVADNVTVRFDADSMILHTHGLPNHPTGRFPEDGFGPSFNPNSIQEQDETFYIPLVPKVNPNHFALSSTRSNGALNMGPIGVAVNGVVFFNPFDAGLMDASNLMDRCCGHPNPFGQYHYHKYPICLNSPWADEGNAHSPLIGWAFDGFPIYGPYESANIMAKDETGPAMLNAFNIHYDAARGWHYHVTPGKFPYLIGGYWGVVDRRNIRRPRGNGPPPGGGPPPDGPPPF